MRPLLWEIDYTIEVIRHTTFWLNRFPNDGATQLTQICGNSHIIFFAIFFLVYLDHGFVHRVHRQYCCCSSGTQTVLLFFFPNQFSGGDIKRAPPNG